MRILSPSSFLGAAFLASSLLACSGAVLPSTSDSTSSDGGVADASSSACPDGRNHIESCGADGVIRSECCPTGAHCSPPASFCNLGGGHCAHDCDDPPKVPTSDSCEQARDGMQCSSEGKHCGDCPNPCARCGELLCSQGKWTAIGVDPNPSLCATDAGSGSH